MTLRKAITAFFGRGLDRGHAAQMLLYSGGIGLLLLLLARWLCGSVRADVAEHPYLAEAYRPELWSTLELAALLGVSLLALALLVLVPAAIVSAVAREQRAGTLEQLRTTPIAPLGLLLGFVLGTPARIYLLCSGPLALYLVGSLAAGAPASLVLATLVVLLVGGLSLGLLAAALGLAPRRGGGAMLTLGLAGALAAGGLISMAMTQSLSLVRWSFVHPAGAAHALLLGQSELWRHIALGHSSYWYYKDNFHAPVEWLTTLPTVPLFSVTLYGGLGLLLGRASCRKLAAPHLPLLAKLQALALFALASAAGLAPLLFEAQLSPHQALDRVLAGQALALPLLALLVGLATPSRELWTVAARRPGPRPGMLDDGATAVAAGWLMVALFWGMCWVSFGRFGFPQRLEAHELAVLLCALVLMLTVPLFVVFGLTRYASQRARLAFAAAIAAHVVLQLLALALAFVDRLSGYELLLVKAALLSGLAVPAWVVWRLQRLRRRTASARPAAQASA